jgi:hypothetical protein
VNGDTKRPSGSGRSGSRGGTAGGVYSAFQKEGGKNAAEVNPDPFPTWYWVSVAEDPPTREYPDLEDRAAKYLHEQNVLLINADFRVFTDMINHWVKEFGETKATRETVTRTVRAWFEQALVEAVIGAKALEHSKEWNSDQIRLATSEEALTTAVLPRYHVYNSIKRELSAKLGRLTKSDNINA